MEELRSTDILDKEIQDDARKKAKKIENLITARKQHSLKKIWIRVCRLKNPDSLFLISVLLLLLQLMII